MNSSIVIALPQLSDAKKVRLLLEKRGLAVAGAVCTGAGALSLMSTLAGGILVCGYHLQDMYYRDVLEDQPQGFEMILVASLKVVGEAPSGLACLTLPIRPGELAGCVEHMLEVQEKKRRRLRQSPGGRTEKEKEDIARAKALLAQKKGYTEEEAHRYLQKRSMETGSSLVETAQMVLMLWDP